MSTLPSIGPAPEPTNISGAFRRAGMEQLARYPVYGLVEWARTSEAEGSFIFHSFLAEGAWTMGRSRLHYRFERTERPEEERTLDPFRSVRPHFENSIHGITRWTIHTLGYGFRVEQPGARLRALPFVEISMAGWRTWEKGSSMRARFMAGRSFWSVSIGVRAGLGMPMHRMGRYGVALDTPESTGKVA